MSTSAPSAKAPRSSTIAGLVVAWSVALAALAMQVAHFSDVPGVYGWNTGPDGVTVTSTVPEFPAAQAGIQPGDRVDYSTLSLAGRLNTDGPQALGPDEPLTVQFWRDGQMHTITMRARSEPVFRLRGITTGMAGFIVLAVGTVLVLLRASRVTWGFLIVGFGEIAQIFVYRFGSSVELLWSHLAFVAGIAAGWAGLLMFVSRFPTDEPKGWLRILDRAAIPVPMLYFVIWLYIGANFAFSSTPPAFAALLLVQYVFPAVIGVTALLALLSAAIVAKGSARQRLLPVLATFALWSAISAASVSLNSIFTTEWGIAFVPMAAAISLTLFAIATAYGVARHRVIDVTFIISRTVVYTLLTAILIGVFAIVDILVARWLERSQLAIVIELVVAVLMGVWLRTMHRRIDHFVDSVLFRRRHLAERRLARVAKTLPHAANAAFVDESLVVEPAESLDLASSAIFRRNGDGRFDRRFAQGWSDGTAASLDASDHLVVQLEAELDVVRLTDVRWPRTDI
ncbi:MAG TPA: hypothetical protein VEJ20_09210, partial [Candidatus Eremiobacteraceae bacterium]|nr:hypothetical protein [Candidatus Eremiobacteraceae bacterium]